MKEPGGAALKRYISEDDLTSLLSHGYREEVRAFTRQIESDISAVLDFQTFFDSLHDVEQPVINWAGSDEQCQRMDKIVLESVELNDFLEDNPNVYGTYLKASNHGPEMTFEIGWGCSYGRVVWNRWTEKVDDPVIAFSDVAFAFDIKEYRCGVLGTFRPEVTLIAVALTS